jgi:hypothetical protein
VEVRVAIPAANPPDNAFDLTSPTFCRASHLRTLEKPNDPAQRPLPKWTSTCWRGQQGLDQVETMPRIPVARAVIGGK